jgi:hypothetical protein
MAKGGQKDHSGMNKETYDRHYAANKYQGGHHGVEGSPNKQVGIATQQQPAQQIPQAVQQPAQQMTNVPPASSNTLGQAQPVFNQQAQQNAQGIFGGIDQRQNSVGAPLMFDDQTGDGKITQADIIKARKEGYKKNKL